MTAAKDTGVDRANDHPRVAEHYRTSPAIVAQPGNAGNIAAAVLSQASLHRLVIADSCNSDASHTKAAALTLRLIGDIVTRNELPIVARNETNYSKGGRPRKHDSAAARQAAYRARNGGIVTWRIGDDVAEKIKEISATVDLSANELANQMLKFALMNRDWRQQPMFGKALPNAQRPAAQKGGR